MPEQVTFSPAGPRSVKLRCDTCGATGYDTGGNGWMKHHTGGHAPCPRCGRMLTLSALGHARRHPGCRIPTDAQLAVDAIRRALEQHARTMSPHGTGYTCACGNHYDTREQWQTHQATQAERAAAVLLDPHP